MHRDKRPRTEPAGLAGVLARDPSAESLGALADMGTDVRRVIEAFVTEGELEESLAPVSSPFARDAAQRAQMCRREPLECVSQKYSFPAGSADGQVRSSVRPGCDKECLRGKTCEEWTRRLWRALNGVRHIEMSYSAEKGPVQKRFRVLYVWVARAGSTPLSGWSPTFSSEAPTGCLGPDDIRLSIAFREDWPWRTRQLQPGDLSVRLSASTASDSAYLESVLDPRAWLQSGSELATTLVLRPRPHTRVFDVLAHQGIDTSRLSPGQRLQASEAELDPNVLTHSDRLRAMMSNDDGFLAAAVLQSLLLRGELEDGPLDETETWRVAEREAASPDVRAYFRSAKDYERLRQRLNSLQQLVKLRGR